MQTLKSVSEQRVRNDYVSWQAAGRQQGHHHETCIAGGASLRNDVFGRPVSQNTLNMSSAECNFAAPHPQSSFSRMQVETSERPYTAIAAGGMLGGADFMGVGRDLMAQDLYGEGSRGNFVLHGGQGLSLPSGNPHPMARPIVDRRIQPGLGSHDAVSGYSYRG